jgi:hypothetical protein
MPKLPSPAAELTSVNENAAGAKMMGYPRMSVA